MKDVASDAARLASLQASPRQIQSERGMDYDDVISAIVGDNTKAIQQAIAAAESLKAMAGGESVTWKDVLFLTKNQASDAIVAAALAPEPQPNRSGA